MLAARLVLSPQSMYMDKNPAFVGSLKDGDVLRTSDVRLELIYWLVVQSMDRCPPRFYNTDYRNDWKVAPYIPLVKQAVKEARKSSRPYTTTLHAHSPSPTP